MPPCSGNAINPEVELHYCAGIRNFGDELSPYLISKITGRKVSPASSSEGLYAIGSLLTYEALRSNCVVWGTGTLHHDDLKKAVRLFPLTRSIPKFIKRLTSPEVIKADFRAVRGPLTRKAILKEGGKCPEIYGDPAIIMPRFYAPKVSTNYKAGLILHHTQETTVTHELATACGFHPISINRVGNAQLEAFIDEVCSCQKVFSTSLHGVILAQAYGIPAQWIQIKGTPIHRDANHKFADYFLGVELPVQKPFTVELRQGSLSQLVSVNLEPVHISNNLIDNLLDAFPFDILPPKNDTNRASPLGTGSSFIHLGSLISCTRLAILATPHRTGSHPVLVCHGEPDDRQRAAHDLHPKEGSPALRDSPFLRFCCHVRLAHEPQNLRRSALEQRRSGTDGRRPWILFPRCSNPRVRYTKLPPQADIRLQKFFRYKNPFFTSLISRTIEMHIIHIVIR